ncbi:unnamed protein product [Euphydryas editha]|uniref:Uncharacterized protein n=1 Tax=Euphydryas editha TaxID=104508 RepID=A0AAU9UFV0_EUPED|nr:unnamed protein product [Euphydryas editha]
MIVMVMVTCGTMRTMWLAALALVCVGAVVGSPSQLDSGASLDPVEIGEKSDIIEYREKRNPRQNWLQLLTTYSSDDDEEDNKPQRKSGNSGGWPLFLPVEIPTSGGSRGSALPLLVLPMPVTGSRRSQSTECDLRSDQDENDNEDNYPVMQKSRRPTTSSSASRRPNRKYPDRRLDGSHKGSKNTNADSKKITCVVLRKAGFRTEKTSVESSTGNSEKRKNQRGNFLIGIQKEEETDEGFSTWNPEIYVMANSTRSRKNRSESGIGESERALQASSTTFHRIHEEPPRSPSTAIGMIPPGRTIERSPVRIPMAPPAPLAPLEEDSAQPSASLRTETTQSNRPPSPTGTVRSRRSTSSAIARVRLAEYEAAKQLAELQERRLNMQEDLIKKR